MDPKPNIEVRIVPATNEELDAFMKELWALCSGRLHVLNEGGKGVGVMLLCCNVEITGVMANMNPEHQMMVAEALIAQYEANPSTVAADKLQ